MSPRSRLVLWIVSLTFVACFGSQSLRVEGSPEGVAGGVDGGADATSPVSLEDADVTSPNDASADMMVVNDAPEPTPDASEDASVGPKLLGLSVSAGSLVPAFDPKVLNYTLTLPFWVEQFAVSPVVAAEFAARVAGVPVTSGQPSKPLLATVGSTLQISVAADDAGAQVIYGIAITKAPGAPLMFKATNPGANDAMGAALAISGDVAVVGAWGESSADVAMPSNDGAPNSGAVYVYTRAANNTWSPSGYLKASNVGAQDRFGESVAIDGDTLVVGARFEDSNATGINGAQNDLASNSGAVYVFRRNGAVWQQEAYLKASNAQATDEFGSSVAIRGDRIAVGAIRKGASIGAAYVFRRNGTVWQEEATFPGTDPGAGFGISVALDDQRLVVGSRYANAAKTFAGAAFVYLRAGTAWSLESTLTAPNARNVAIGTLTFGTRVALHGDLIAVSDPFEDGGSKGINGDMADTSVQNAGAVYLYRRGVAGWTFEAYVKPATVAPEQRFGAEIAIEADRLVVGAPQDSSGGDSQAGAVFAFRRFGQVWFQEALLKSPGPPRTFDVFGQGITLSGGRMFVGATGEDSSSAGVGGAMDETLSGSGAAFLFP